MSLYDIPNAPGSPRGRLTSVGWDSLYSTFYAQAYDEGEPGETRLRPVFNHGSAHRKVPTVEALEQVLAQHQVQLPAIVQAALIRDQRTEGGGF